MPHPMNLMTIYNGTIKFIYKTHTWSDWQILSNIDHQNSHVTKRQTKANKKLIKFSITWDTHSSMTIRRHLYPLKTFSYTSTIFTICWQSDDRQCISTSRRAFGTSRRAYTVQWRQIRMFKFICSNHHKPVDI